MKSQNLKTGTRLFPVWLVVINLALSHYSFGLTCLQLGERIEPASVIAPLKFSAQLTEIRTNLTADGYQILSERYDRATNTDDSKMFYIYSAKVAWGDQTEYFEYALWEKGSRKTWSGLNSPEIAWRFGFNVETDEGRFLKLLGDDDHLSPSFELPRDENSPSVLDRYDFSNLTQKVPDFIDKEKNVLSHWLSWDEITRSQLQMGELVYGRSTQRPNDRLLFLIVPVRGDLFEHEAFVFPVKGKVENLQTPDIMVRYGNEFILEDGETITLRGKTEAAKNNRDLDRVVYAKSDRSRFKGTLGKRTTVYLPR